MALACGATRRAAHCYDGGFSVGGAACGNPSSAIPNAAGRLTSIGNTVATTDYNMGTDPTKNQCPFSYLCNQANFLTRITYPSDRQVNYTLRRRAAQQFVVSDAPPTSIHWFEL